MDADILEAWGRSSVNAAGIFSDCVREISTISSVGRLQIVLSCADPAEFDRSNPKRSAVLSVCVTESKKGELLCFAIRSLLMKNCSGNWR